MTTTNRRDFLSTAACAVAAGATLGAAWPLEASEGKPVETPNNAHPMKIIIAADPFAVTLKKAVAAYLKEKGHEVIDLGATDDKAIPYYDGCAAACRALQAGQGERGIFFCGTGMGMSIVANRFKGITASVVESVFAARMCRAINNANVLCLGSMIWGEWMAKEAVAAFLNTNLADGLPQFADFLKEACQKVSALEPSGK